ILVFPLANQREPVRVERRRELWIVASRFIYQGDDHERRAATRDLVLTLLKLQECLKSCSCLRRMPGAELVTRDEIGSHVITGVDLPRRSKCACCLRRLVGRLIGQRSETVNVCTLGLKTSRLFEFPQRIAKASALQVHRSKGHAQSRRNAWLCAAQLLSNATLISTQTGVPTAQRRLH